MSNDLCTEFAAVIDNIDDFLFVCNHLPLTFRSMIFHTFSQIKNTPKISLPWNIQRLLWIGNLKEDKQTCPLATLPKELILEIIKQSYSRKPLFKWLSHDLTVVANEHRRGVSDNFIYNYLVGHEPGLTRISLK
ncbi:MAG: hypothetical protein QW303_02695 [Nitrososphaerota archaeon]